MAKPPTKIFYEWSMCPGDPDDIEDRIDDREKAWVKATREWLDANPTRTFKRLRDIPSTLPADVQWGLEQMLRRWMGTRPADWKRVKGG